MRPQGTLKAMIVRPSRQASPRRVRSLLRSVVAYAVTAGTLAGAPATAWGHALLTQPQPRDNRDDHKDGSGGAPCGAVPRTGQFATYTQGQTVTVNLKETIDHSGCFVVSLIENDDTKLTLLGTKNDPVNNNIPTGGRDDSFQVTLPAGVACERCTLQLRQLMLGAVPGNCATAVASTGQTYYSCADIRITYPDGGVPPPYVAPSDGGAGDGGGTGGTSGTTSGTSSGTATDGGKGDAGKPTTTRVEDDPADEVAGENSGCAVGRSSGNENAAKALALAAPLALVVGLVTLRRRRR